MSAALPFTLRISGPDQITRGRVESVRERYAGVARLGEKALHLEWSGKREHTDVKGGSVSSRVEQLPVMRLTVPARSILEATLRQRLWRPHVRLRVTDVSALDGFPTAAATECRLDIAHEDRARAVEFLTDLRLLIADAELEAAEDASRAVDAAARDSFPASDPPAFTPLHIGEPGSHPDARDR